MVGTVELNLEVVEKNLEVAFASLELVLEVELAVVVLERVEEFLYRFCVSFCI